MSRVIIIGLGNFFVLFATNVFLLFLACLLLERPLRWIRHLPMFIANTFAFSCFISLVSLMDLYLPKAQLQGWTYAFVIAIQLFSSYLLIRNYFPTVSPYANLFIQSVGVGLMALAEYVLLSLSLTYIQTLPEFLILFISIPLTLLQVALSMAVCYTLRKTQIAAAIRKLLDYKRFMLLFAVAFFLSDILSYFLFFLHNNQREDNSLLLSLGYLILLVIFGLWAFAIDKNNQWEYSKNLLAQQQLYLGQLEEVQRELRSLQHDYKNMLAGIYFHAHEGNTQEIQSFLSEKLFQIDTHIEERLMHHAQLQQIQNMEIKGLLMTKLALAESKGCKLVLEVPDKITEVAMKGPDLLRVLGIFLDNAIEAVAGNAAAPIYLLILSEEDGSLFTIKNPLSHALQISDLLKPGFSTKGSQRGLGLANVRSILAGYPNALNQTSTKDKQFVQTLLIQNT